MITHKLTHSEETLVCDLCDAGFKCLKYLQNHQIRKHKAKRAVKVTAKKTEAIKREAQEPAEINETHVNKKVCFEDFPCNSQEV